jgi:ribosomal protein L37AE/L43A
VSSLDDTFVCQRLGKCLAHKHCLRRQVDLQEATELKTGKKIPGPPVHSFCASGRCDVGWEIRAQHADVRVESCKACGHALVGPEPCPRCAAREVGKQVPHVLPEKGPMSERIWTHPPVEPPFIPPTSGKARPRSNVPALEAEGEAAPLTQDLEGIDMADKEKKLCSNCGKKPLRSDNSSGICNGCRKAPAKGRAGEAPAPRAAATPAVTRAVAAAPTKAKVTKLERKAARRPAQRAGGEYAYLANETVDDLVAALAKIDKTRNAVFAELRRRREEISAALGMDKGSPERAA